MDFLAIFFYYSSLFKVLIKRDTRQIIVRKRYVYEAQIKMAVWSLTLDINNLGGGVAEWLMCSV